LLSSSVISLASNIPPELIARQVEADEWTTQRAMAYAAQMTTRAEQRAKAYACLLKTGRLSYAQRQEAELQGLSAASAITRELSRAQALIELAPSLSGDILTEALDTILDIENGEWRAMALVALAPRLIDPHLLDRALVAAWALPSSQERHKLANAPMIMGTHAEVVRAREWTLSSLIQTALLPPLVWNFSDQDPRGLVVSALVPQLDHHRLAEVLKQVWQIQDEANRAQALAAFVPLLTDDARNAILTELLDLAGDRYLVWLLARFLPHFRAAEQRRARTLVARCIQDLCTSREPAPILDDPMRIPPIPFPLEPARIRDLVRSLAIMTPWIGFAHEATVAYRVEELIRWQHFPAGSLAPAKDWETDLARLLIALAPYLQGGEYGLLKTRAQEAAYAIQHPWYRERVLLALSPEQHDRPQAARTVLEGVKTIRQQDQRIAALQALGPYLEGALLEQSIELALAIEQVEPRLDTLGRLAAQLAGPLLARAVEAAHGIEDETARVELFSSLLPHLDPRQVEVAKRRALDAVRAIPVVDQAHAISPRAQALMALAPYMIDPQRKEITDQALQAVQRLKRGYGDNPRLQALAALAPLLSHEQRWPVLKQELDAVYDVEEPILNAKANALLLPYLEDDTARADKRDYALDTALSGSSPYNAQMLVNLAPHLTDAQLAQVMNGLPGWFSPDDHALILTAVASHWQERERPTVLSQALEALTQAESVDIQVMGLRKLAPHLEGELLATAWALCQEMSDQVSRASAMTALAPRWETDECTKKLDETLAVVQKIVDGDVRARALGLLAGNQAAWVQARPGVLWPLLVDVIHSAANGKRHMFLRGLHDLQSLWLALTPQGTAWEVTQTIIEVSQQWQWQ
jgi:hypothetical protein